MGLWKDIKNTGNKIIKAGDDIINGKAHAAEKAANQQKELYNQAYGENAFSGAAYDNAQRNLMNQQISGEMPTVSQQEVDQSMKSVVPQINASFQNNPWSTAKIQATADATQKASDSLVNRKSAQQQSALDRLRQEASNRANTKIGQAGTVQAMPTLMDTANDALKLGSNAASLYAAL
jgi:hypothetical protein